MHTAPAVNLNVFGRITVQMYFRSVRKKQTPLKIVDMVYYLKTVQDQQELQLFYTSSLLPKLESDWGISSNAV